MLHERRLQRDNLVEDWGLDAWTTTFNTDPVRKITFPLNFNAGPLDISHTVAIVWLTEVMETEKASSNIALSLMGAAILLLTTSILTLAFAAVELSHGAAVVAILLGLFGFIALRTALWLDSRERDARVARA